jgi:XAP5 circadian clock regulator/ATP synthase subunit D
VQLILVLQHHTFYDFIINKARGKSGPLFNFDVHDDVRLLADATLEKDESHAGKVVERSWYQRNKHIFPASRWEVNLRCSSRRPFANSLPQLSRCAAAHGGIRCLTRRKTTESIPSLRLCESSIVSRFIRDAISFFSTWVWTKRRSATYSVELMYCGARTVRTGGPCAISVLSLLSYYHISVGSVHTFIIMSGTGPRESIFPTRMALTNTKTRLKGAQTGHSLLAKKRDALTTRFRAILRKVDEVSHPLTITISPSPSRK